MTTLQARARHAEFGLDAPGNNRQARVQALLARVEEPYREPCRSILAGEPFTFTQAWQDWWLFHNLYFDRLTWGDGAYVDIGTNDPTAISNTLFFDKCLGWKGVCFEPQQRYHERIRTTRSCHLVPRCVLGSAQTVHMAGSGTTSRVRVGGGAGDGEAVTCAPADGVLRSLGFGNATHQQLDLLSVDVEGFEAEVLRCFPFREFGVQHVLLETNAVQNFRAVDRFFHRHGYASIETFTHGKRNQPESGHWLDNLFEYRGPARHPPTGRHGVDCSKGSPLVKGMMAFCAPWQSWAPASQPWGQCSKLEPKA